MRETFNVNIVQVVYRKIQIRVRILGELRVAKHERLLEKRRRYDIDQVVHVEGINAPLLNEVDCGLWIKRGHAEVAVYLGLSTHESSPLYFLHKPAQNGDEALRFIKMLLVLHKAIFAEFEFYKVGVSCYMN
jgi:hypothetical protein